MPNQPFTVVSLFKLILVCAVLSLVVRPVAKGIAQDELEIIPVVISQITGALIGIMCGIFVGLTQFRRMVGIRGGAICGMIIGFFLGNIFLSAGRGETALTMLVAAVITLLYGILESAANTTAHRRMLETKPPSNERADWLKHQ
ncbi:hypothetical protein ACFL2H_04620 [Planctomycetota bacterium]